MKLSQLLIDAKTLISDHNNWIKGNKWFRDGDNIPCQFCTIGAIDYTAEINSPTDLHYYQMFNDMGIALQDAGSQLGIQFIEENTLAVYNDLPSTTHTDIMALYDKAIEMCKRQGQ